MSAEDFSPDCLFCRIVTGEVPAEILAENELALVIRDIAPVAPTHALVLPRRHVVDVNGLGSGDGELLSEMIGLAQQVAALEGRKEPGYRLVFNVGRDGGNTVAHLHLHLLGGRQMTWPPG